MMPSEEVKIEKRYNVGYNQLSVTIQAGEKGWTVLFADGASDYLDKEQSSEANFDEAFKHLSNCFGDINEIS